MPDPVIHFFVPLFVLLAASRHLGWSSRKVLLLSPAALLPDLDVFVNLHHGLGHNVFLFLPLIALYLAGTWKERRGLKGIGVIASLFLLSHLVFDFFQAGLIPLYPIDTTWVKATATLHLDGLMPIAGVETEFVDVPAGGRSPSRPLPLVSPDSLGVTVFSLYVASREDLGRG